MARTHNVGQFQFEALKRLSIIGGTIDADVLPPDVSGWTLHTLHQRGLVKLTVSLTEEGAQVHFRKMEMDTAKEEKRQRRLVQSRMRKSREATKLAPKPIPFPVIVARPKALKPVALPSEFALDRKKMMGAR